MFIVTGMTIFSILMSYRRIEDGGPFHWDEGLHALWGLLIAEDFKRLDLLAFAYDSYRQAFYPPIHSWLLGAFFTLFEPSAFSARLVSLFCLCICYAGILLVGYKLSARRSWLPAGTALLLLIASPGLARLSEQCMLEVASCLFLVCSFYFYSCLISTPNKLHALLLGVSVSCVFLTRYTLGCFILCSLFIVLVLDILSERSRRASKTFLCTFSPVVLLLGVWFLYPPKLVAFVRHLLNRNISSILIDSFADRFDFYLDITTHVFGSPYLSLFHISGMLYGLLLWKIKKLRLLSLFSCLHLIAVISHPQVQPRFIVTILFSTSLLVGVAVESAYHYVRGLHVTFRKIGLLAASSVLFVTILTSFFANVRAGNVTLAKRQISTKDKIARSIDRIIADSRDSEVPLFLHSIGTNIDPPLLDWKLIVEHEILDVAHAGMLAHHEIEKSLVQRIHSLGLPPQLTLWAKAPMERTPIKGKPASLHLGIPQTATYSHEPYFLDEATGALKRKGPLDKALRRFFKEDLPLVWFSDIFLITELHSDKGRKYPPNIYKEVIQRFGFVKVRSTDFQENNIQLIHFANSSRPSA